MTLTADQQTLVTSNMWVVNAILKKQGLQADDDLRGNAYEYLCRLALRYDDSKGISFSTYAYKSLWFRIRTLHQKDLKRSLPLTSLATDQPLNFADIEEEAEMLASLAELRALLPSAMHQAIFDLVAQGYSREAIAEKMQCSPSTVATRWKEAKAILVNKVQPPP